MVGIGIIVCDRLAQWEEFEVCGDNLNVNWNLTVANVVSNGQW